MVGKNDRRESHFPQESLGNFIRPYIISDSFRRSYDTKSYTTVLI